MSKTRRCAHRHRTRKEHHETQQDESNDQRRGLRSWPPWSSRSALAARPVLRPNTRHSPKKINLSGVTLNVGDLAGQTQILLNDSGALKGAQYKVNFATFPAGPPAVAAIQGGSIDLTVTADTPAIFAQAGGVPLKVVAVTQPVAPGASFGLVVPKGSTITSLGGLKGTKIAAASGTILQYIAIQALNGADGGWKNATIVNLNPALALAALTSNSVQAAVLIQPYLAEAVEAGGQVLALGTSYTKGYSYFLAADSALANTKKAAAIADYLHRYAVAEHWAATHTAIWAQDYATANNITLPLATAAVNAAHRVLRADRSESVQQHHERSGRVHAGRTAHDARGHEDALHDEVQQARRDVPQGLRE